MWTEADDAGRGIADVRVLKGSVWPLDDEVTPAAITDHLTELVNTGHIRLYTADGDPYYEVCAWAKHQAAAYRRGEPKHPPPQPAQPCTSLHASECKEVLSLKEFSLKELQQQPNPNPPAVQTTNTPPTPAAAAAAAMFDQAINHAINIRRTQAGPITHPTRWETAALTGIINDHSEHIRHLLNQGETPEHAAKHALAAITATTPKPPTSRPRTNWDDAETYGYTIAQGELERGDPHDPDDLVNLCGVREPAWIQHALTTYTQTHGRGTHA